MNLLLADDGDNASSRAPDLYGLPDNAIGSKYLSFYHQTFQPYL